MFRTIKMSGEYWGVFLINPVDENDRYLVTSTFDKKKDAEYFQQEFTRILEQR